jgi:signal transduction histidine kinase/CheY-like chemotaxis protein
VLWQLLGAAVVLVVAILLFLLVANRVIRPIVDTSLYIASIDLRQPEQYKVPTPAFNERDELGVLITSINRFLENIAENLLARRQAESELKELNADLERRVEERTEELRSVNEALKKAIGEAEQATEAKTAFLANVSHELRTPLNCILGYAQILREDPVICEPPRHYVEIINQSGEHLLDLINEVLEISKIEARKVQLKLEPVDMYRFLDNLEAMFALRAKERELRFTIARSADLPRFLVTDKNKLRQILINLIGNAINHTLDGSVHLALDVEETGYRTTVAISVTDTGVGIAEADLARIFEPFFQVEHSQAPRVGTGLGLSICQGYARLLGSEVTVSSILGQGSTFAMKLVAETGAAEQEEKTESFLGVKGLAAVQETRRILVADDNDASREMLLLVLGGIGLQVREARNGREAVDLFHALHPDLILMDMRMPVLDGLEATRLIRQSAGGGDVRIVAFSGNVFEEQHQEMLDAGCNDVLGKPVVLVDLFRCLKRQLGLRYICS